jgi:hypothetical protein
MALVKNINKCWQSCGKKNNKEPLWIIGRNVNWCSHYGNQYATSSEKLKLELPQDPVIPHLGQYPKEYKSAYNRDSYIPMFIAAQFAIATLWNQLRCSSTDEWIMKLWYV